MQNYSWPGNVRELANVVERLFYVAMHSPIILPEHLPEQITSSYFNSLGSSKCQYSHLIQNLNLNSGNKISVASTPLSIRRNEEEIIKQAIYISGGNISKASRILGVSRSTLYRKIKIYNISKYP